MHPQTQIKQPQNNKITNLSTHQREEQEDNIMKKRALILLTLLVAIVMGSTAQKIGRRMKVNYGGEVVATYNLPQNIDSLTFETYNIYTVTATPSDENLGTAEASATEVEEGAAVTITAIPNEEGKFLNWTLNGEVVSTENPYTATVTANTEFVANIEEIELEYCTISGNSTHSGRYLPSFTLTTGVNDLVVSDIQPSSQQALYHNKTSEVLETSPGTTISFKELPWNGEWMHGYVFIDYNKDGVFNNTLNSNGQTGGELVSYNFYSETDDSIGQNSKGEIVNHSTYVTATSMPEWTIPSDLASGDYRMRFNIAWCSIDPCGSEEMAINGGAMVDITIRVVAVTPRTISVSVNDEAMGTAYVGEEGTTSLAGQTGNVKVVAVANEGYNFVNWTVNGEEVSIKNPYTATVTADTEFMANFEEIIYTEGPMNLFDIEDVDADGWLWFDTDEKIEKYVGICNEEDYKVNPNGKLIQLIYADIMPDYPASYADSRFVGVGIDGDLEGEGAKTGSLVIAPASANMTINGGGFVVCMPSCSSYSIALSSEAKMYVRMMATKDVNTSFTNYDVISAKYATVFKPLSSAGIFTWTGIETLDKGTDDAYNLQTDAPIYAYFQSMSKYEMYIHGIKVMTANTAK